MQSELDRLAGIKSGATATKRSKQDQVVSAAAETRAQLTL